MKLIKIILALLILSSFVSVSLLSETLIHTEHEHAHEQEQENPRGVSDICEICALIHNAQNLLKQLIAAVKSVTFSFACLLFATALVYVAITYAKFQTLVNMKIRFNN